MVEIFIWDKRHRFMAFGSFSVQGDEYDELLKSAGIDEMDADWEALLNLLEYLDSNGIDAKELIMGYAKEELPKYLSDYEMWVEDFWVDRYQIFIEILVKDYSNELYVEDIVDETNEMKKYGIYFYEIFKGYRSMEKDTGCYFLKSYRIVQEW